MPHLSVVVLNWNRRDLTERCVDSIRRHTDDVDYELIVVDNGSDPPTPAWTAEIADVAILHEQNLGFAPGMNAGLAAAGGTFVAFANNDTEFPPLWASRLLETYRATPDAGIVIPAVTAAGNPFAVREAPGAARVEAAPFRDLPSGVVYLALRADMTALGGWDERYRLAGREDLDLLFMMWCNGRSVVLDERVLVKHEASATLNEQRATKQELRNENWDRFVTRWIAAEDVPLLPGVGPDARAARIREAQTAATWMKRWMEERQRFYAKNREWKRERRDREQAEAKVAQLETRPRRGWKR